MLPGDDATLTAPTIYCTQFPLSAEWNLPDSIPTITRPLRLVITIHCTSGIIYSTSASVPAYFHHVNVLLHQISGYFSLMENYHTKVERTMVNYSMVASIG